jgi:hypothetical protein
LAQHACASLTNCHILPQLVLQEDFGHPIYFAEKTIGLRVARYPTVCILELVVGD